MKRILIHIPFGMLIVASVRLHWSLPLVLSFFFWYYEHNEDHWIKDQAWKDVKGVLWGMAIAIMVGLARKYGLF